jgi:alcohol dehydrogenase class IV
VSVTAGAEPAVGPGVRRRLGRIVADAGADRVLLVASERTARTCDAVRTLTGVATRLFTGWAPNPTLEQALAAARAREAFAPDLVVAVGGGSAIDTAKLARSLPGDAGAAVAVLRGRAVPHPAPVPLIAVPTTAGTGSEVTRFATVYVDGVKHSLDHETVRPECAIVDPELLGTCPVRLRYACAFDALCHAVESYWSTRATDRSRALALAALDDLVGVLSTVDLGDASPSDLWRLATAATTAGQAIDVTRTTAAHAFSYRLTSRFGVVHGVACLLNLCWLADHNLDGSDDLGPLREALAPLGGHRPGDGLRALLHRGGYGSRLRDHGVRPDDIPDLVRSGLASTRAAGNPVPLGETVVTTLLGRQW